MMKRAFRFLVMALLFSSGAFAHPLDFLTPEQRVFMMNKFFEAQDSLAARPGKPGAADGSGAAPLTVEQKLKLIEWFMTGHVAGASAQAAPLPASDAKSAAAAVQVSAASPMNAPPLGGVAGVSSEGDLAAMFGKWSSLSAGVKFERFRDGFSINGVRYLDPEGTIVAYGFDAMSGDFTYLAQQHDGKYLLKTGRALNVGEPIAIAKAERRGTQWSVITTTGKKLAGNRLIPLARGFIIARDNTGFRYVPGKGTTSIAAPEAFSIAALQSGDVSSTGFILLERTADASTANPRDPVLGLFSAVQSLGSTLGIGKKEDYALMNIDSNKLVPINISIDDKRVQVMSACRQRNFVFAECERMDSFESLFQANGMRNMTHYFWRINWFNAAGRPVLISQEGGLSKITETDLNSGKKVVVFERPLGIASFSATQGTDGKISVSAKMGFSTESKDDVVALLDTAPDVSEAVMEKQSSSVKESSAVN